MKNITLLILAIVGSTLAQSSIPQNYCDNKIGARCATCVFNSQLFFNACTKCGRNGFASPVPGSPGVTFCRKVERFNSFCEIPDTPESCELCQDGGYWEKSSKSCYQYNETAKVEKCHEYSGEVAGICHVCKEGLVPAQDFRSCVTIPPLVANRRILQVDPANYVNCDLIGREYAKADAETICYTCKEGFYKIDGKCTGVVTEALKGCLNGDATTCFECDTVKGYVMRTPSGKCEMYSGILSTLATMIALLVINF